MPRTVRASRSGEMTEVIGWLSSVVLVVTIGQQVYKQWHDGTSKGVSTWLFVGQTAASAGFTVYSYLVHNWVFVVTNALMLVSSLLGFAIVMKHARRERRQAGRQAGHQAGHQSGQGQRATFLTLVASPK